MTMSSTDPMRSSLSLKTACPSTWRFALQPRVTSRSSAAATPTNVEPATCACAMAGAINAMAASINMRVRFTINLLDWIAIESCAETWLVPALQRSCSLLLREVCVLAGEPGLKRGLLGFVQGCYGNVDRGGRIPRGLIGAVLQLARFPLGLPFGDLLAGRGLLVLDPTFHFRL